MLRGGFGIFYAHPFDGSEANTATLGFAESSALVVAGQLPPGCPTRWAADCPSPKLTSPVLDDTFGAVKVGQAVCTTVTYLDPNRRTGYSEQFNLRIQHELPGAMLVEIGYLGNLSRKLPGANIATNQIRPELLAPTRSSGIGRSRSSAASRFWRPAFGVSSYNAGTAKIEKRFAHGFSVLATYTWAKFLDNTGGGPGAHLGDEGAAYSNYYNRRNDWGPSENDIRHRLTWSSVYQIPVGEGRRYFQHRSAAQCDRRLADRQRHGGADGRSFHGADADQHHLRVLFGSAARERAARSEPARRPALARSVVQHGRIRAARHESIRQPGRRTGARRRHLQREHVDHSRVPAGRAQDAAVPRRVLQSLNHPNFLVPGHTFNGAGFGIVDAARPARQVQLGLRLTY